MEPLYKSFEEVLDDILLKILHEIGREDYALFGHSLGGKIAFELAQRIQRERLSPPKHLIISGRGAPLERNPSDTDFTKLSDEDFIIEITKMGSTPVEIFENQELREFFLPILRNDFRLAPWDAATHNHEKLQFPITIFCGKDEGLTKSQISGWQKYSALPCNTYIFEGDHFFIQSKPEEVVATVNAIFAR